MVGTGMRRDKQTHPRRLTIPVDVGLTRILSCRCLTMARCCLLRDFSAYVDMYLRQGVQAMGSCRLVFLIVGMCQ